MGKSTNLPLVSIIIVNYNRKHLLADCIDSILNTDYPNFKIIVVDQGSTDDSPEFISKRFYNETRLKIVQNAQNLGYAEGMNSGIRVSKGEYVVVCNNDIEVERNWLWNLLKTMEGDERIAAAQCKLLSYYDNRRIDGIGADIDIDGCHVETHFGEIDREKYNGIREIPFVSDVAGIIRRDVLNEAGLFDPVCFFGYSDIDLSWRIRLRGYKLVIVPSAIVYHKRGRTQKILDKTSKINIWRHFFYARIHILIVNHSCFNLFRALPNLLLLYLLATLKFLIIDKDVDMATLPIKSILWNLKELRSTVSRRVRVRKLIKQVSDGEVMKFMSKKCIGIKHYIGFQRYVRN